MQLLYFVLSREHGFYKTTHVDIHEFTCKSCWKSPCCAHGNKFVAMARSLFCRMFLIVLINVDFRMNQNYIWMKSIKNMINTAGLILNSYHESEDWFVDFPSVLAKHSSNGLLVCQLNQQVMFLTWAACLVNNKLSSSARLLRVN